MQQNKKMQKKEKKKKSTLCQIGQNLHNIETL